MALNAFTAGACGVACVLIAAAFAQGKAPDAVVGAKVHVSASNPGSSFTEQFIVADGRRPGRLLICAKWWAGPPPFAGTAKRTRITVFLSDDGGRRWRPTLRARGSDPACEFGADGAAYLANLPLEERVIEVHRSADGGDRWAPPLKLNYMDREYLVADTTSSKTRGRVYLHGAWFGKAFVEGTARTLVNGLGVLYSSEAGRAFVDPVMRASLPPQQMHPMGNSVVLSNGTFAAVFTEHVARVPGVPEVDIPAGQPNATLWLVASDDSADSSGWLDGLAARRVADIRMGTDDIPIVAVDPGSTRGKDNLYVTWIDARAGYLAAYVARSTDRGRSWSQPLQLSGDSTLARADTGTAAGLPRVAVNRHGVICVAWRESLYERKRGRIISSRELFRISTDQGATWLPAQELSESVENGDDTAGLAADANGVFHAVWLQKLNGVPQLWTAPITVR